MSLLETLNIFAVRANYMGQFRDYLEKEGVETEGTVDLPLFVWANKQFLRKGLVVPRVSDDSHFATEATIVLAPDPVAQMRVDMSLKVETIQSSTEGFAVVAAQAGRERPIPDESLGLVNWERAYLDLLEYNERKGLRNLVIPRDAPRCIISHKTDKGTRLYRLVADETVAQFVRDLKAYWAQEKDKSLAGAQVFLLRNLSRGSGIGFFEERGLYPDFILWIVEGKKQHVVFIEPHGMLHANAYQHDEKARLHEALPELAKEIAARSTTGGQVTLDSYIISATHYDDLRKKYDDGMWDREKFAGAHILFLERNSEYDYMQRMFKGKLKHSREIALGKGRREVRRHKTRRARR